MGFRTQWRGQRDTLRWRLRTLVLASVLLHVPLSPLGALLGLVSLLDQSDGGLPDLNAITAIPVDLIGDGDQRDAADPSAPPEEPLPDDVFDDLDSADEVIAAPDAGAPEPDAAVEPEIEDAGEDASEAGAEEDLDGGLEGGTPGVRDPAAIAGPAAQVAAANAHVRLFIYMERIRNHAVGPRVGELLKHTWQWQDFFGPAAIDPVQDIDRIYIAGPQLRNSSEVGAVLQHNVPPKKMRSAVDRLVQRDQAGGVWLDAGVPAAEAKADGALRLFVMPGPHLIAVAPPGTRAQLVKFGPNHNIPPAKGNEVVFIYLDTPWRAVRGLRFNISKSVKWARINIFETPGGGAVGRVEAEDGSPEEAKQTAAQMSRALRAYVILDFIEKVSFRAQDTKILGEVVATKDQVTFLLELALQQQKAWAKKVAERRAAAEKTAKPVPEPPKPAPKATPKRDGGSPGGPQP